MGMKAVELVSGKWVVMADDRVVAGPFRDNAAAWSWIDRHNGEGADDRYCRIRVAYAERNYR